MEVDLDATCYRCGGTEDAEPHIPGRFVRLNLSAC